MKIFLIRHGESIQNVYENFEKLPDFLIPLTKKGEKQANECGKFLKEYCKKNNIDLTKSTMIVSPFERTRQTAKIVNEHLNISNILEDAMIIERQYGLFDTLTFEEREKYNIAFEFQNWMYQHDGFFYTKFPLGESNFDVFFRARFFLNSTFKDIKTENLFIVSHGGFLKSLQMAYFGYSPEWFNKTPFMNNCDVKLMEIVDDKKIDRDYILHHENI